MTIKWGDPIECNGVRPDWLRGRQPLSVDTASGQGDYWLYENARDYESDAPVEDWAWSHSDGAPNIRRFKLPADHPAYVALARGFTPWSGGESAPDDWDGRTALLADGEERVPCWWDLTTGHASRRVIGYRKRNTRFDDPHLARIEVEGCAPVDGVFVKRMTEAEFAERFKGLVREPALSPAFKVVHALGLIESRAERFTRETGHAVTEAVEAALNWKGE